MKCTKSMQLPEPIFFLACVLQKKHLFNMLHYHYRIKAYTWNTRCTESFATFFILHISRLEKMIKSWFFFQKMQHEKLYKKYIRKYLLIDSKDFFVVIINNLYDTGVSQHDKNACKFFLDFYISWLWKMI